MAQRLYGLIGPGKGPRLTVPPGGEVSAHVRGLKSGVVLIRSYPRNAHLLKNPAVHEEEIREDGSGILYYGDPPSWVEFEHRGNCQVICTVRIA
jgi:hypothetical protein